MESSKINIDTGFENVSSPIKYASEGQSVYLPIFLAKTKRRRTF